MGIEGGLTVCVFALSGGTGGRRGLVQNEVMHKRHDTHKQLGGCYEPDPFAHQQKSAIIHMHTSILLQCN